jgi:hypothetical protein
MPPKISYFVFQPPHCRDAFALASMQLLLQKLDWQILAVLALLEDGDTAPKLIVDQCVGQLYERL